MARELTIEEEKTPVMHAHKHVDNGGITVEVYPYGTVCIEADFWHSKTRLIIDSSCDSLDWMIEKLTEAKYKLKALHDG